MWFIPIQWVKNSKSNLELFENEIINFKWINWSKNDYKFPVNLTSDLKSIVNPGKFY